MNGVAAKQTMPFGSSTLIEILKLDFDVEATDLMLPSGNPSSSANDKQVSNRGHSASIPKDYTPSSSVPVMVQETVKPTTAPTVAAPTAMPTFKPTTQQTQKSPAPFVGLIAGLGIAGLVLSRLRK